MDKVIFVHFLYSFGFKRGQKLEFKFVFFSRIKTQLSLDSYLNVKLEIYKSCRDYS